MVKTGVVSNCLKSDEVPFQQHPNSEVDSGCFSQESLLKDYFCFFCWNPQLRCQKPLVFDDASMLRQCRYSGLLEAQMGRD